MLQTSARNGFGLNLIFANADSASSIFALQSTALIVKLINNIPEKFRPNYRSVVLDTHLRSPVVALQICGKPAPEMLDLS